ncbi:MAG: FG-GAP-like repeat-containing protein [Gammaproteobacteria bacterium]
MFGSSTLSTLGAAGLQLSALNGANGFKISGGSGAVSRLGDVNGDGRADLLIGAPYASPNGASSGASYVVFGSSTLSTLGTAGLQLSALNGANGFKISGEGPGNQSGRAVSGLGDVNGDGRADLLIGAPYASPSGASSGASYVVFGSSTLSTLGTAGLQLSALNGAKGFKLSGAQAFDQSGFAVSGLGDFNGDGRADLFIGAPFADPVGDPQPRKFGASYVVFGGAVTAPTVTGSGPATLAAVLEDAANPPGATVSSLFQSRYSAPSNAFAGVAVVGNPVIEGDWQSSPNGTTWTSLPTDLSDSNATLLSPTHRLRFVPGVNLNGAPGSLSVRLWDGTGGFTVGTGRDITASTSGFSSFTPTVLALDTNVTPVNDAPQFTALNPSSVLEDAGAVSEFIFITFLGPGGGNDEASQTVAFIPLSAISNPALFSVPPAVSSDGTLTYTPAANANGSSTFQVRVKDSGGIANGGVDTSAPQTLTITVDPVNDAPSFTKGPNQTVAVNAGAQSVANWATALSKGPANEASQTLGFQVTNNNNAELFAVAPAVSPTGTLSLHSGDQRQRYGHHQPGDQR